MAYSPASPANLPCVEFTKELPPGAHDGRRDGYVGCGAMRAGKAVQWQGDACRRRVEEHPRGSVKLWRLLDKAEEQITDARVRAGERIESMGLRVGISTRARVPNARSQ